MKIDDKIIVLTESTFDVDILKRLLPTSILEKTEFIPSMGFSGAISKAKSLAIQVSNRIILVLDSDTVNENEVLEKKDQLEYIFESIGKEENVDVFLFTPEIEVIFFESNAIQNKIENTRKPLTHLYHFSEFNKIKNEKEILQNLTEEQVNDIRINSSLKQLIEIINKSA
jgi:hypothetical protein